MAASSRPAIGADEALKTVGVQPHGEPFNTITLDARSNRPFNAVRQTLSVMFTCGMYDGAGARACKVGLPAKRGVGGGILAVVNRQIGVGVFFAAAVESDDKRCALFASTPLLFRQVPQLHKFINRRGPVFEFHIDEALRWTCRVVVLALRDDPAAQFQHMIARRRQVANVKSKMVDALAMLFKKRPGWMRPLQDLHEFVVEQTVIDQHNIQPRGRRVPAIPVIAVRIQPHIVACGRSVKAGKISELRECCVNVADRIADLPDRRQSRHVASLPNAPWLPIGGRSRNVFTPGRAATI
jgi:hypothetical protein